MKTTGRFDARAVRDALLTRGGPDRRRLHPFHAYRPFDNRWLYWERDTKLLDEKRADYRPHVFEGNVWLSPTRNTLRKGAAEPQACLHATYRRSLHLIERTAPIGFQLGFTTMELEMPAVTTRDAAPIFPERHNTISNVSACERGRICSTTFSPPFTIPPTAKPTPERCRMEWPRIPLPSWPDGTRQRAQLERTRPVGGAGSRALARLLDPDIPVPGVTQGALRPEIAAIAVPAAQRRKDTT